MGFRVRTPHASVERGDAVVRRAVAVEAGHVYCFGSHNMATVMAKDG